MQLYAQLFLVLFLGKVFISSAQYEIVIDYTNVVNCTYSYSPDKLADGACVQGLSGGSFTVNCRSISDKWIEQFDDTSCHTPSATGVRNLSYSFECLTIDNGNLNFLCGHHQDTPTPSPTPTQGPSPTPAPIPTPSPTPAPDFCHGSYCATLFRLNCLTSFPTQCGNCFVNYAGAAGPSLSSCTPIPNGQRLQANAFNASVNILAPNCTASPVANFKTLLAGALRMTPVRIPFSTCKKVNAKMCTVSFGISPSISSAELSADTAVALIAYELQHAGVITTVLPFASPPKFIRTTIPSQYCESLQFPKGQWIPLTATCVSKGLIGKIKFTVPTTTTYTFGDSITLTVVASKQLAQPILPAGEIAFFSNNELIPNGLVALPTTGKRSVSFTVQLPTTGINSLTAAYYGDKNYLPSYTGIKVVDVAKYTPLVKITVTPTSVAHGKPITVTTSIVLTPPKFPVNPTGHLHLYNGNKSVKTYNYKAPSTKTTFANLPIGAHSMTVHYLGDTNFNKKNSVPIVVRVCPGVAKTCAAGQHALCCTATKPVWSCKPTAVKSC